MAKKKSKTKVCDELWSKAVKKRAGYKCEYCGKETTLQSHHMIPRTNYATRYMLENGVCLCYKHHFFFAHKDALGFGDWFKKKRKKDVIKIESMRGCQLKNDYSKIELDLKNYLESL